MGVDVNAGEKDVRKPQLFRHFLIIVLALTAKQNTNCLG